MPRGELEDEAMGKILLVGSDLTTRTSLNEMISNDDFKIEIAASGFEAGIQAESIHPDCVVVDFVMGREEALMIAQNLRRNTEFNETVLIGLLSDDDNASGFDRSVFSETFRKPFDAALPAERVAAKADELVDDGVFLHSDGANVVLIGKGRRGALNAVYTYLERQIGFHWPEPSRELTPSGARLNLDALDMVSNPALRYRGIAIHGACGPEWFTHILDWLAKNRMNSFQLFPAHYEQLRDQVLGCLL